MLCESDPCGDERYNHLHLIITGMLSVTTQLNRFSRRIAWLGILLYAGAGNCATPYEGCVAATPALAHMQEREIRLESDGEPHTLRVRVADEGREKAAGFQYICPAAYKDTRILFVYDREIRVMFHMRNVLDKLDIGFFDQQGRLFEVQQMQPYPAGAKSGPRTTPSRAFRFALEAPAGYFSENRLPVGKTTLQWTD